jgi:hypothetical protein
MSEEEMAGLKQEGVIGSVPLAARAGLTPEQTLAALATRFEQLLDVKAVIRVEPDYREQLGLEKRQP